MHGCTAAGCENGMMRCRPAASKHEGAGNDFLVVLDPDDAVRLSRGPGRACCDRHRGVGADGLIRVGPGRDGCDLSMELRNADGGEAEMSGNGMRCLAQAAVDAGLVAAAALHRGHRGRRAHGRLPRRDGARVGRGAASTWARPGSGPTSPGVGDRRARRSTSATRTWSSSAPTRRASTSAELGPELAGAPSRRHQRRVHHRRLATTPDELLDCGSGSAASARPGLRHRERAPPPRSPAAGASCAGDRGARAQPGRDPRGRPRGRRRRRPRLAGPVRKVADVVVDPGMLS